MKSLKQRLQALLCNPDGKVVIEGSEEDKKLLEQSIEEVGHLEIQIHRFDAGIREVQRELAETKLTPEEKEIARQALNSLPGNMLLSGREYSDEDREKILNTLKSIADKLGLRK